MRFRISTLLLVVVIIALSTGWTLDRLRFDAELNSSLRTQALLLAIDSSMTQKLVAAVEDRDRFTAGIDGRLIAVIVEVFENADRINDFRRKQGDNENAVYLTNKILRRLRCESTESYLSQLSEHWGDRKHFARYTNPESPQHGRLKEFVENAINSPMPRELVLDNMNKVLSKAMTDAEGN